MEITAPKITAAFNYIGKFDSLSEIETPKDGDVCTVDATEYVYGNNKWIDFCKTITVSASDSKFTCLSGGTLIDTEPRIIQITKCPQCDAPLSLKNIDRNGLCQCEYCNSMVSVYLKR